MPLTRSPSAGNINCNDDEVDLLGQASGSGTANTTTSQMVTRRQAQLTAARNTVSENRVHAIIKDSLDMFRTEMSTTIGNELRSMIASLGLGQQNNDRNSHDQDRHSDLAGQTIPSNMRGSGQGIHQSDTAEGSNNNNAGNWSSVSKEKMSNLISSWHVTFGGLKSDVTVKDFIYRINTLTRIHLNGDFDILCRHAHTLFEGQANQWFWRYHRQTNGDFIWVDLCQALKKQFQETTTDYDLKDDMRRRKQRPNENFDEYLDTIMRMSDRLSSPVSEQELIEIVVRNLRTEL